MTIAQLNMLLIFLILAIPTLLFLYWNRRRPKRNSVIWLHPEKGGGMELGYTEPESNQVPYYYKYDPWSIRAKPIYLFQEVKNKETGKFERKAYEPSSSQSMTPNDLYDNIDWEAAHRFLTIKSTLREAIKFGMAAVMVIACIFGIVVLADML